VEAEGSSLERENAENAQGPLHKFPPLPGLAHLDGGVDTLEASEYGPKSVEPELLLIVLCKHIAGRAAVAILNQPTDRIVCGGRRQLTSDVVVVVPVDLDRLERDSHLDLLAVVSERLHAVPLIEGFVSCGEVMNEVALQILGAEAVSHLLVQLLAFPAERVDAPMAEDVAASPLEEQLVGLEPPLSLVDTLPDNDSEANEPALCDTHLTEFVCDLHLSPTVLRVLDPEAQRRPAGRDLPPLVVLVRSLIPLGLLLDVDREELEAEEHL
jgi:hypothetical protein